ITKSTPFGSLDAPFNPVSLALGAEATFVARTLDTDRRHLTSVLRAAVTHRGAALVEIYQNCNIYNDGAFDLLKDKETRDEAVIRLEEGEPIRFGADGEYGVVRDPATGALRVASVAEVGEDAVLVHDPRAEDPTTAFALSRLSDPQTLARSPIGIFRQVQRPTYDDLAREQIAAARAKEGDGDLAALLAGSDTWTVQ